jgi:hypothetical protein
VLIRVAFGGKVGYNFLESYWFNLQYWNGKTTLGEYELGFKLLTNVGRTIADVPNEYELKQNFPNPFNPSTSIKYYVAQTSKVRLSVFDLLGKETVILVNTTLEPGSYTAHFDAKDLPSGIYLYRLQAGSYMITKKLIILR